MSEQQVLWQRAKTIVADALVLPPDERSAYVDACCADDRALHGEVTSLLRHATNTADFIESPAALGTPASALAQHSLVGARVGAYCIAREIGQGGMGVVYAADRVDGAYVQRVAIKILRNAIHTEADVRRMQRERQALAALNHPHIAHLLDGGTTENGLPYLVMEFVDGDVIDVYAKRNSLSLTTRVGLVRAVCAAVQSAHQQLLIHRDIKPANILVTHDGVVKLLDFGIARLLASDQSGLASQDIAMQFTPRYASPEQVRGQPVSVATDVYGLGLLLYDLLAGASPYPRIASEAATSAAMAMQIILADAPKRASEIAAQYAPKFCATLEGELDTILLKACAKEPRERYATVAQLDEDLRRWLNQEPITARAPTWGYRARKFVARNRVASAVAASALVVAAGLVTMIVTERNRAQYQAAQTRQLANKLIFDYYREIEPLAGAIPVRKKMLEDAGAYLDKIALDAPHDVRVAVETGAAYRKLADAQYNGRGTQNLGNKEAAEDAWQKARVMLETALTRAPNDRDANYEMGRYETDRASLEFQNGNADKVDVNFNAAIARYERVLARVPGDAEIIYELFRAHTAFASVEVRRKKSALAKLADAQTVFERLKKTTTDKSIISKAAGFLMVVKANDATQRDDAETAIRLSDEQIAFYTHEAFESPNDINQKMHLFNAYSSKAVVLMNAKRSEEAIAPLGEAITRQQALLAANPIDASLLGTSGRTFFIRARAWRDLKKFDAALADFHESKRQFDRAENLDLPLPMRRLQAQSLGLMLATANALPPAQYAADAKIAAEATLALAAKLPAIYAVQSHQVWLNNAKQHLVRK